MLSVLLWVFAASFHLQSHLSRVQSQVIDAPQPIAAALGDDIILPCHLEPPADAFGTIVEWTRPDLRSEVIHIWRNGLELLDYQIPAYRGRTSLFREELKHGNVSLKLSNVKLSDEGRYRCFVSTVHRRCYSELTVGSASSPVIKISKSNDAVMLECESAGWYPEPEVRWLDAEGNIVSAGPTETLRGPDGLYNVSSSVTVDNKHGNTFTCKVQETKTSQTREAQIHVSVQSQVIDAPQPIAAALGDDIILPCHLEPPADAFGTIVEWTRPDLRSEVIHIWRNGLELLDYQIPAYRGRTSLFREELKHGNVSLKLSNVKLSDEGTYRCFVSTVHRRCYSELTVVQSQVIDAPQTIVAALGDDIILPCRLEPPADAFGTMVEWTRPDLRSEVIHIWRNGLELLGHQNPAYRGRTSLFRENLKHGNVSLKLSNVKLSDGGTYMCIVSMHGRCYFELTVGSASSPVIKISKSNDAVMLECESAGWYPEPEVLWLDAEGNIVSAGPTETLRGPDGLYNVSSSVTVDNKHGNTFTCKLQENKTNQTREAQIDVSVQSQVSDEPQPIAAALGDDIILPCRLEPPADAFGTIVEWRRPDLRSGVIHIWLNGLELLDHQNPAYRGRTSLFREELKHGNVSLKLSNVKLSDEGTYMCIVSMYRRCYFELTVGSASSPVIKISKSNDAVMLECESAGWYPEPEVLWLDAEGNIVSAGPTETLRGPDGLYNVSSSVSVDNKHGNTFTCKLQENKTNQTREAQIHVSAQFQVIDAPQTIVAALGDDIILPCRLEPPADASGTIVEWTRPDLRSGVINIWRNGLELLDHQNPAYRGRTSLFREELKHGNVSLKLSNVKLSDEGTYMCIVSMYRRCYFELTVVQSQVIDASQPIAAALGDDIILPCHLEPPADAFGTIVEWTRPDLRSEVIHIWRNGLELLDHQIPAYRGRTSLFREELKHGNVSLKLSNVKLSDEGTYRCFVSTVHRRCYSELTVGSASSPVIKISKPNDAVMLECESAGWYPEPEVRWLDAEGNIVSAGPTETLRGPDGLYNVSSSVTVDNKHSNTFTCKLQENKTNQTREAQIHVSAQSQVIDAPQTIVAVLGDDIILPCCLESPADAPATMVHWTRPDLKSGDVYIWRRGLELPYHQIPAYRGRTSLFRAELKHGNVSLKLSNVTLSDGGKYRCFDSMHRRCYFELTVVQSQAIDAPQPIAAALGDDIILPCRLEPPADASGTIVEWRRPDLRSGGVYICRNGLELPDHQIPAYRGRTSLFREELKHGNVSLKLSNVKLSDGGTYRCLVSMHRRCYFELTVGSASSPVIKISKPNDAVMLECESAGWYPEPEVLWLDAERNIVSAGPTETLRGPDGLYTVSSSVTVDNKHGNTFTCKLQENKTSQTREAQIHVSDDFFKFNNDHITIIVSIVIIFVLIAVFLCLASRIRCKVANMRQSAEKRLEEIKEKLQETTKMAGMPDEKNEEHLNKEEYESVV
ncbi:hemicentin-1-like isoform X4 [Genypterus blacodes]|uniref:hemicentin-1-like isoform X4 n=1 Tax=Genypterus blacodes TaxID=154954 RepID=UPI003F757E63